MKMIIEFINKYIGGSQYKKNLLTMMSGRIFSQILPILFTPILTRIYSPSDYGVFGVFSTLVAITALVSSGRYPLAILLPKKKSTALDLIILSNLISVITSIIVFCLLVIFNKTIFNFLNVSILSNYIILIVLSILFVSLFESLYYYVLREKKYRIIATNFIIQAIVILISRIILGKLGYTSDGLMISFLLSYMVGYILLRYRLKLTIDKKLLYRRIKRLLVKYQNFPKFSIFADLLKDLTLLSPNIILNMIFGTESAGLYSMSDKILGSPITFITISVGDVFKQEASEQYRRTGRCKKIFTKTARSLFFLGIIPFLLIFIFVPGLIPIILGNEWADVGIYIRIFCIMYFARFVVIPVSYITYIVNKQKINILFQIIRFLSIVIGLLSGMIINNINFGLIVWSTLTVISYVIIYIISYNIACNAKTNI